jgi:hypothetical protein
MCLPHSARKGSALKNLAGTLHTGGAGCTLSVGWESKWKFLLRRRRPCHSLIFDVDPAAASSKRSCAPRMYQSAHLARARSSNSCPRRLASARWKSRRRGFAPLRRKDGEAGTIGTSSWPIGSHRCTTTDGWRQFWSHGKLQALLDVGSMLRQESKPPYPQTPPTSRCH